ncbi:MAG: BolA family protein [Dokdonella sp.]
MTNQARVDKIRECLVVALEPQELEIRDDGHLHVGHAGARDGRGHFHVRIVSSAFCGQAPLARHRAIYAALGDMMQTDIHALAIDACAAEES